MAAVLSSQQDVRKCREALNIAVRTSSGKINVSG